jgi:beta-mannosidase
MDMRYYLNKDWKLKVIKYPDDQNLIPSKALKKWIPAAVPGTVHTDLFNAGLIEDPFNEQNEYKLEWISRSDCIYQKEFDYPGTINKESRIKLIFEGLDTAAEIFLNSKLLGRSENMFLKQEFNVTHLLKHENNVLEVRFESPVVFSLKNENKYGKLSAALNANRVHIRKAQYSFGWDWGPSYPTMGIWRPVYLQVEDNAVIKSLHVITEKLTKKHASVKVNFSVEFYKKQKSKAVITLSHKEKEFRKELTIRNESKQYVEFSITNPEIWWPNGYGEQNLYQLNIKIIDGSGNILDEQAKNIGIRTIDLQLNYKGESTFRFIVNGKPIYVKGMNWIPADPFLPRVNENRYRKLLTLGKNANANMLRVWGGGIYEDDVFYNLCDELGLLVWQDFMFACAAYPEYKSFLSSVTEEIAQNVERLRSHPCIAIWCGNNENEWIWYQAERKSYKEMPGYRIFHKLIPELMSTLDPSTPYWPTSPFGFDEDPNSQNSGNRHQWDIWSNWKDYSEVETDQSLFVTEFGFQGPANIDTFNKYLPAEKRNIQSPAFEYYNKQVGGPERIVRFLSAHLPLRTGWNDFIYLAQLNQGLALKKCIEHWRTNQVVTNGSIIWQLNDTWPVTSWALIDSDLKPKLSYHFVKNVFSSSILYFNKSDNAINLNLLNESKEMTTSVNTVMIDLTGKYLFNKSKNISTDKKNVELEKFKINTLPADNNWIIIATLFDINKNIIHRNIYLEKEWKHIKLPEAGLSYNISQKSDGMFITLTTNKPAFFIDVQYPGFTFAERGFILLPGEVKQLEIIDRKDVEINRDLIKILSLNDYLEH